MDNSTPTPEDYQEENNNPDELLRRLELWLSDQNWISPQSQLYNTYFSHVVPDSSEIRKIFDAMGKGPRPDRDTRNFGYDSRWEGVDD